jgi:hypothetical protein
MTHPLTVELIALGNSNLKTPSSRLTTAHLLRARSYFSKALLFMRKDPSTPPKDVSRVCQKLMESSLLLSQITRSLSERKEHAEQAQRYGEAALENVTTCGDTCMVRDGVEGVFAYEGWRGGGGWAGGSQGADGDEVGESEGVPKVTDRVV